LFLLILNQTGQRLKKSISAGSSSDNCASGSSGSGSCLARNGYEALVKLSQSMATQCQVFQDFVNARGLLQVASMYYCLENGPNSNLNNTKEYLQSRLKDQVITKSLDMWQFAFSSDVEAELMKNNSSNTTATPAINIHS
jgi:hypothetical protein